MNKIHQEHHFMQSERVRDVVIGMADGLTVPFALAAGIAGTSIPMDIIVTAGMAEIAAGSIAMGLGGYLAARSGHQHYQHELKREELEIIEKPEHERREIIDIMAEYEVSAEECAPLLKALERNPRAWRDFMMRFELGLEKPDPQSAKKSALTIGLSYIFAGLIPLTPYMLIANLSDALLASTCATLTSLLLFGYAKGCVSGGSSIRSAIETFTVGGLAALAAFGVARLLA